MNPIKRQLVNKLESDRNIRKPTITWKSRPLQTVDTFDTFKTDIEGLQSIVIQETPLKQSTLTPYRKCIAGYSK